MNALVSRRRLLQGGLVAGVAVALGVTVRLDAAAPGFRVLSGEELGVVHALAEAMFPGDPFPLDGIEAGVPETVDRIVGDVLEPVQQAAFRYVLRVLEYGTLASRGVRFSRLPAEERREVLDVWSDPALLPRRVSADAIKLVLGMAYFNHPAVLAHIGWRKGCVGGAA